MMLMRNFEYFCRQNILLSFNIVIGILFRVLCSHKHNAVIVAIKKSPRCALANRRKQSVYSVLLGVTCLVVQACVHAPSAGNYFDGIGSDGLNGSESVSEHRQLITIH